MQPADIKQELNAWLDANWDPELSLLEWRNLLLSSGWAVPAWPKDWFGREFDKTQARAVSEVLRERRVVGVTLSSPNFFIANTLLRHGSDDQKRRYLRYVLTGEHLWCQLFSEPGSGSDLAGASTKAERQGNRYIVNGQKVWTTSAHHAHYGFLLARTDWDLPKHEGLSYFLIDMKQPGVQVKPLRQMNGYASFNEVFFTDAEVVPENMVGQEGEGWKIASATLSVEREAFLGGWQVDDSLDTLNERIYREYRAEQETIQEPYKWYPQRTGRVDLALPRAEATQTIDDPIVRQELARLLAMKRASETLSQLTDKRQRNGDSKGQYLGALGKLTTSFLARQAAHVHTLTTGIDSLTVGESSPEDGLIAEILLSVPAISIAGGTDEIQRNIVAERILELPKEKRADTGPFRDIPRG